MSTAQIIQFPNKGGNVREWATTYLKIFKDKGQEAAGRYARDVVPEQFHLQVDVLVKEMNSDE